MDKKRCFGTGDELYEKYHDTEWGRPVKDTRDERELFERLCLEAFQSGLSWITVLRKRPAFRKAFANFAPAKVAKFDDADVERLMGDASIIRNRIKINAAITNAKALRALHASGGRLLDVFVAHAPPAREAPPATLADVPGQTVESVQLSKALKKLGFTFVGPVTMYATLQALGLADDHVADCWLRTGAEATAAEA